MSCQVCTDKFNKIRKQVKCSCDYECCTSCAKTYILSKSQNAHCMNCNVAWNKEFLVNNLGHTFIVKEYQPFRANVLYERELSLLPEAHAFIDNEKRQMVIREEIRTLTARINMLKREFEALNNGTTDTAPVARKEFIRQCPNTDCNGFLSKDLHCSLCGVDACGTCREIKIADTEHVCNEDVVKTIQLLQKDTKECPSCASLIFKISGCSQMFCTSCHKVFDWNTLKIETGVVHNPHYFEWVRQNGVDPRTLNAGCNRYITNYSVNTFLHRLRFINVGNNEIAKYMNIFQRTIHIREVDMRTYQRDIRNNIELRVKFLKKEIDIDHFKTQLRVREKRQEKNTEMYNILDMHTTCVSDLANTFINTDKNLTDFLKLKTEIKQLTTYTQGHLLRISKVFKCKEYILYN